MLRLNSLLSLAGVYRVFQRAVGGTRSRTEYVRTYVRPVPGNRVLDIGCGPADILAHLPPGVDYLGIDVSESYIEAARRRFGDRGRFRTVAVGSTTLDDPGTYDLVMANGVLHHLDDQEADQLLRLARLALKPGGRLVTFDGCYHPGQPALAKLLLGLDRGRFVRRREEYLGLASRVFSRVESDLRQNLMPVPYTLLIMTCTAPPDPDPAAEDPPGPPVN